MTKVQHENFFEFEEFSIVPFFYSSIQPQHAVEHKRIVINTGKSLFTEPCRKKKNHENQNKTHNYKAIPVQ